MIGAMPGPLARLLQRWRRNTSFALNELDLKLANLIPLRNGFFVEAGANDGYLQSNSLYFERKLGWSGLLIEPIPDLALQCRRNRPRCLVEQAALVSPDLAGQSVSMQYCHLMSLVHGAMKSPDADAQHVALGAKVQKVTPYEVLVPGRTLSEILDQYQITHVDLLSLDVEGFELQALQGLDLSRHRPDYVLVECRFRAEISAYLSDAYVPLAELSHHDLLFAARGNLAR